MIAFYKSRINIKHICLDHVYIQLAYYTNIFAILICSNDTLYVKDYFIKLVTLSLNNITVSMINVNKTICTIIQHTLNTLRSKKSLVL